MKAPRTSRQRGGTSIRETRPHRWAGTIGFLLGRGYSSAAVAEALGDGTLPATIRALARAKWKLPGYGASKNRWPVAISFDEAEKREITLAAARHGLTAEEYCRRILVHGSMPRDRYRDLVGDRFVGQETEIDG